MICLCYSVKFVWLQFVFDYERILLNVHNFWYFISNFLSHNSISLMLHINMLIYCTASYELEHITYLSHEFYIKHDQKRSYSWKQNKPKYLLEKFVKYACGFSECDLILKQIDKNKRRDSENWRIVFVSSKIYHFYLGLSWN